MLSARTTTPTPRAPTRAPRPAPPPTPTTTAARQLLLFLNQHRRPQPPLIRCCAADPSGRSATPTRTAELPPSSSACEEDDNANTPNAAATATASASSSADDSDSSSSPQSAASASRAERYNALMRERMGWRDPYQYHPELGLYHHEVAPGVVVGTQPRGRREVDRLIEETHATAILCLQEDKDAEHWGVDLNRVIKHAESRGLRHLRAPARDFDGDSLRGVIPRAAALLQREMERPPSSGDQGGARVYVHCTAGLGRAPAVAIAWRYWFGPGGGGSDSSSSSSIGGGGGGDNGDGGDNAAPASPVWSLDAEYDAVTRVRPCGPRREAILGATADLLRRAGFSGDDEQLGAALTAERRAAVQQEARRALDA